MRIITLPPKIKWVYALKTLGIVAVVLGHITSPFSVFIFSWHMPLFFAMSGFFVKFDVSLKEFIVRDFKRLMVPYFLFAMIALGAETFKRIALQRESLDYFKELQGIFIWMDMSSLLHTYAFVLWFLPALFFARVILVFIDHYIRNIGMQFLITSILFASSFYINLPFGFDNAMNALFFVFVGSVFFRFYQESKILYSLPFLLIGLYFAFGVPLLDIASKNYENVFINICWALAIIGSFILMLKYFNYQNKILTLWGGNTMLLFIVHPYTNNIAHLIVEKVYFGDWYLKLFISLILLHIVLLIKLRFENRGIFYYV